MFLLYLWLRETERSCTVIVSGFKLWGNWGKKGDKQRKGMKERRKEGKSFAKGCWPLLRLYIILIIADRYSYRMALQLCYHKTLTTPRPSLLPFQTNIPINKASWDRYQLWLDSHTFLNTLLMPPPQKKRSRCRLYSIVWSCSSLHSLQVRWINNLVKVVFYEICHRMASELQAGEAAVVRRLRLAMPLWTACKQRYANMSRRTNETEDKP